MTGKYKAIILTKGDDQNYFKLVRQHDLINDACIVATTNDGADLLRKLREPGSSVSYRKFNLYSSGERIKEGTIGNETMAVAIGRLFENATRLAHASHGDYVLINQLTITSKGSLSELEATISILNDSR